MNAGSTPRACRVMTLLQYAKSLGVRRATVKGWIDRGELAAVNVAKTTADPPRWRITEAAAAEFERKRAAQPKPKPVRIPRRQTKKQPGDYF